MYIVIVGYIIEGVDIYGPFEDAQAASDWATGVDTDCLVTKLLSPETNHEDPDKRRHTLSV